MSPNNGGADVFVNISALQAFNGTSSLFVSAIVLNDVLPADLAHVLRTISAGLEIDDAHCGSWCGVGRLYQFSDVLARPGTLVTAADTGSLAGKLSSSPSSNSSSNSAWS